MCTFDELAGESMSQIPDTDTGLVITFSVMLASDIFQRGNDAGFRQLTNPFNIEMVQSAVRQKLQLLS